MPVLYRVYVNTGDPKEALIEWHPLKADAIKSGKEAREVMQEEASCIYQEVHVDQVNIGTSREDLCHALSNADHSRSQLPGENIFCFKKDNVDANSESS